MKSDDNLLLVADSEQDANMLYAVGMFVPDPFIYLRVRGRGLVVMSDLELDRARRQAPHCRVLSLSRCRQQAERDGLRPDGFAPIIQWLLRRRAVRSVEVPETFPHGLACELQQRGVHLRVRRGSFFPERERKRPDEVKKLSAALMMAEVGLAEGIELIKRAKIARNGRLLHNSQPLTSEKVRSVIDVAILKAGGLAAHTIVAGGRQGCDPHERGYGPLRAHEPIIIDVFPRSQQTGYFGDITRTVVRGKASEAVRRLYATVAAGQALAFRKIKDGVPSATVHQAVLDYFTLQGYKTRRHRGHMEGFFHGTGHGLGLEIHESPRVSQNTREILRQGHVVTVEPGLYYPELGGVRLEDVACLTRSRVRNLTRFEKTLEV